MAIIVEKFGGSSLANADRICHVADLVIKNYEQGNKLVVVVSAMYGETDRLIAYAKAIQDNPSSREYAVLVSSAENVAMSLLTMAIQERGYKAKSYTGNQACIHTNSEHENAKIKTIKVDKIMQDLNSGYIVVVAGFQGVCSKGDITTLGRGGSDTTAVALAAAISAKECRLYTDVDGVYTADPHVITNATKLPYISFEEMLVLSLNGAKVIQPRAVELAAKYNTPTRVLSSFIKGEGTLLVHDVKDFEAPVVRAITSQKSVSKINIETKSKDDSLFDELLQELVKLKISIDMVHIYTLDHKKGLSFVIKAKDCKKVIALTSCYKNNIDYNVTIREKLAKLSIVGLGLRGYNHLNIVSKLLSNIRETSIDVYQVSTGDIKLSFLLNDDCLHKGLKVVHKTLGLHEMCDA